MKYKLLHTDLATNKKIYSKIEDDDKSYSSCSEDDQKFKDWVAAGNTPEAATSPSTAWDQVRRERDSLLSDSDWTMITGCSVDQAQWSAYREKLRDIPQTYKNVSDPLTEIVWPTLPSTKGPNS